MDSPKQSERVAMMVHAFPSTGNRAKEVREIAAAVESLERELEVAREVLRKLLRMGPDRQEFVMLSPGALARAWDMITAALAAPHATKASNATRCCRCQRVVKDCGPLTKFDRCASCDSDETPCRDCVHVRFQHSYSRGACTMPACGCAGFREPAAPPATKGEPERDIYGREAEASWLSRTPPQTATFYPCPNGCGAAASTADVDCPGCRRPLNATAIEVSPMCQQPDGSCWEWWGPADHRMRCRKPKDHRGPHSTHNDCGRNVEAQGTKNATCGEAYGHAPIDGCPGDAPPSPAAPGKTEAPGAGQGCATCNGSGRCRTREGNPYFCWTCGGTGRAEPAAHQHTEACNLTPDGFMLINPGKRISCPELPDLGPPVTSGAELADRMAAPVKRDAPPPASSPEKAKELSDRLEVVDGPRALHSYALPDGDDLLPELHELEAQRSATRAELATKKAELGLALKAWHECEQERDRLKERLGAEVARCHNAEAFAREYRGKVKEVLADRDTTLQELAKVVEERDAAIRRAGELSAPLPAQMGELRWRLLRLKKMCVDNGGDVIERRAVEASVDAALAVLPVQHDDNITAKEPCHG